MGIWNDWNRTTRFVKSTLHALDVEHARVAGLSDQREVLDLNTGTRKYRVTIAAHKAAVADRHMLFAFALVFSYGSAEDAARKALSPTVAAREPIESWGARLLARNGKKWPEVHGGETGAAEVAVVRNLVAHGLTVDQNMLNRIKGAGTKLTLGCSLTLTAALLEEYRARLRSLLRISGLK